MPVLKVYHDCNNEGNPCKRKIKFEIPKHNITDGNYPAKWFDLGAFKLWPHQVGDEKKC